MTTQDGSHHLVARAPPLPRHRIRAWLPFLVALVDEVGEAEVYSTEIAARMHQLKERAREAISLLPARATCRRHRPDSVAVGARRFRRQCLRPHADRARTCSRPSTSRAPGQAAAHPRAADRSVAPVQADRRADARIAAGRQREHIARAAPPDPEGLGEGEAAGPRSPSCARPLKRPKCPRRPRSRR